MKPSPVTQAFLLDVRSDPRFPGFIEDMKRLRPDVPKYDYLKDNIEEVKCRSLLQQGFDKLFTFISLEK